MEDRNRVKNGKLHPSGIKAEHGNNSEIVKFFSGKNVFITGGTGYLGRVLIWKLLTYCPDIGKVYLLMREKKGVCQEKRLEDMKGHFMFQGIEKNIPGQLDKMHIVQGNIQEIGLAISEEDRERMKCEINIIFHSAATIQFNDLLSKSVSMNVRGTKELMDLAKGMKNLVSFIHVSTCYVHCHLQGEVIREEIYPPEDFIVREVLDMCEHNLDVNSEERTNEVIGERPNTYTFTKAITEQLINQEREHLPISIVRPSIVTGSIKEPIPGWIDSLNGAGGITVGVAHGALRSMYALPDNIADLVPVDTVINLMCAVAYKTSLQYNKVTDQKPIKIPVYNCNSGTTKPITWREACYDHCVTWNGAFYLLPFDNMLMPPGFTFSHSKLQSRTYRFFAHLIPAYIVDTVCRLSGKKPYLKRLIDKMHRGLEPLEWFASRQWIWDNDNVVTLSEELNATDNEWFDCRMVDLDWHEFWMNTVHVLRKHVLKYDDNTIEANKTRLKRLSIIFELVKGVITLALVLFVSRFVTSLFS